MTEPGTTGPGTTGSGTPASGAREEILRRIRSANRAVGSGNTASDVAEPVAGPTQPAANPVSGDALVELFAERVADYRAEVTIVSQSGDVPAAIAGALHDVATVVIPDGVPEQWLSRVQAVQVSDRDPSPDLSPETLDGLDAVVTGAALGVAVTGTIVLDHAAAQGRRALSLVPDLHVCVVFEEQIVPDVPEATAALEAAVRAGRPLTWVSGPSATSDIELNRVEGVHGPRTLRVIVVRGPADRAVPAPAY